MGSGGVGYVVGGRRDLPLHMAAIDPPLELVNHYRRKRFLGRMRSPSESIQDVQGQGFGSHDNSIFILYNGLKAVRLERSKQT